MPGDPPSNPGSNSTRHRPYPSPFIAQDGRIEVPRTGPGSMYSQSTAARLPSFQRPSGGVIPGQGSSTLAIEQPWYHPFVQPTSQVSFGEIPAHTPSRRRQGAPSYNRTVESLPRPLAQAPAASHPSLSQPVNHSTPTQTHLLEHRDGLMGEMPRHGMTISPSPHTPSPHPPPARTDLAFPPSYAWGDMHHFSPYPKQSLIPSPQQPPPAPMSAQVTPRPSHHPHVPDSLLAVSHRSTQPGRFPAHPNCSIGAERQLLGPGLPHQHIQDVAQLGDFGRGFGPVIEPSRHNLYSYHPLQQQLGTHPELASFNPWEGQSQMPSTSLLPPPEPATAVIDATSRTPISQLLTNDRGQELDRQTVQHRPVPYDSPQASFGAGAPIPAFGSSSSRVPVLPPLGSLFNRARNFEIESFRYVDNATHVTVNSSPIVGSVDGWELLLEKIAPNALHDSSARYDAPKCDEDTRVEVTGEIMDQIKDRDGPRRILCMTGAAGSGKSALQQTVAERCETSDILAAAYFISSADPTRNKASAIVPTIAYQLGLKHDGFRHSVAAAVNHDRHIFSRSLRSQMDTLIIRPFKNLRRSKQLDVNTFPHAILIDGLDECNGKPTTTSELIHFDADERRQAEGQQTELLTAIKHCILDNDLPFRFFIASRPEIAIRTALKPGGHLHEVTYHIQLSDNYDASGDMRKFLRRRFEAIGLQFGDSQWFTEGDIETLVRAASGQFIYVAVVYKYISEPRTSPAERLKIVLTWTPHEGQMARPFEALDRLYTNILLRAKSAYEAVDTHHGRDFLLLFRVLYLAPGRGPFFSISADILSALLGIEVRGEENLISDLRSLVTLEMGYHGLSLEVYHKSFSDFLDEKSRAKSFFVPKPRIYTHLAKCCMQRIVELRPPDLDSLPDEYQELPKFRRDCFQKAVELLPYALLEATATDDDVVDFTEKHGWHKLDKLLPMMHFSNLLDQSFRTWTGRLYHFAVRLKIQRPEIAAIINGFIEKWEYEEDSRRVNHGQAN